MAPINWRTITLEAAISAVKEYNLGSYYREPNLELDHRAQQTFSGGLARTLYGVYEQVYFIGHDYGGAPRFVDVQTLSWVIAEDIYANLDAYGKRVETAPTLIQNQSPIGTIELLLKPFNQPLGSNIWLTWASKFWHFLNPSAFLMGDTLVCKFFGINGWPNGPYKYSEGVLKRFCEFAEKHQEWIEPLREADGGHAWSDTKLWDKVFYSVNKVGVDVTTRGTATLNDGFRERGTPFHSLGSGYLSHQFEMEKIVKIYSPRADAIESVGERLQPQFGDDGIPRQKIRQEVALCGYKESSIIPSDFCYNYVNEDPISMIDPMFLKVEPGRYIFLGRNYPYSGPVYWKPKGEQMRQVGEWINGTCTLYHDPRKR